MQLLAITTLFSQPTSFKKHRGVDYAKSLFSLKYRNWYQSSRWLIVIGLLGFVNSIFADIYWQVLPDGRVKFSDTSSSTTKPVFLKTINSFSHQDHANTTKISSPLTNPYQTFAIQSPQAEQTFQNQANLTVNLIVNPALKPADKIELWLDNNLYQRSQALQTTLQNLDRGEHQLQAKIVDAANTVLMTTAPVTFYVHYAINGNA